MLVPCLLAPPLAMSPTAHTSLLVVCFHSQACVYLYLWLLGVGAQEEELAAQFGVRVTVREVCLGVVSSTLASFCVHVWVWFAIQTCTSKSDVPLILYTSPRRSEKQAAQPAAYYELGSAMGR